MPYATMDDGVKLYYESTGSGFPILFIHEFAGDYRSWEPQVRHFSRSYRCVTYSARGYPPSDVPTKLSMYNQARVVKDAKTLLDHLGIGKAHIVGLSMGGYGTLNFGLTFPRRARSLVIAGCGYGSIRNRGKDFDAEVEATAAMFETGDMEEVAGRYGAGPTRVQFKNKNPRGWAEFRRYLAEHSPKGSALTQRGVQKKRPTVYDLEKKMQRLTLPTLVVVGDEDEPCLEPSLFLKRRIPASGLVVLPKSGHVVNLEEPEVFNRAVGDFLAAVELGKWGKRDRRATVPGQR